MTRLICRFNRLAVGQRLDGIGSGLRTMLPA
jgi:hypothetical protein